MVAKPSRLSRSEAAAASVRQAEHQEKGAEHAAEQDHRGEPGDIRPPQRRFDSRQSENAARQVNDPEADPCA
jgi:hypothetical protein